MFTKRQLRQAIAFLETFDKNELSKLVYKNKNFGVSIALKNPKEDRTVHSVNVEKVASIDGPISIKNLEGLAQEAEIAQPAVSMYEKVLAPMTGAFYRKAKPESEFFVQDGSFVEPTTTVCLLEAMKMFTEVKAGIKGKIVKINAADNSFVTEGDVLFEIQPM